MGLGVIGLADKAFVNQCVRAIEIRGCITGAKYLTLFANVSANPTCARSMLGSSCNRPLEVGDSFV